MRKKNYLSHEISVDMVSLGCWSVFLNKVIVDAPFLPRVRVITSFALRDEVLAIAVGLDTRSKVHSVNGKVV